ncbi:hypothetical protein BGZ76_007079 [Entomortierella beljakovae]|nr:hypothetical protein BGZ76_007079 [Entomortierella beljakovae]
MTKLIQAAPEARGDRAWIVPEKIIPYRLIKGSTSKHDSSRFGIGKWVHSGTQTLERMTKEGKYKMINPSAYMRPDIARLVYAQWTIRVAYDLTELGRQKNKHFNIISKPKELAIRDSNVEGGITDFDYKRLPRLQCVLFFGSSGTSSDSKYDDETTNSDLKPTENSDPLISVDITRAGLPINHPEGLAAIRKYLSVGSISRLNSAEHPSIQYIGLVESQKTLNATMNLWKLASILPKL